MRASLAEAAAQLAAVSETPRLDAELLMAHALVLSREDLLLRHLDDPVPPAFDALIARRLAHEPVAYITGSRDFWTIELLVGPGVLVPRADSETLIEAAIAHFAGRAPATILDLGTGPGTLLLAALEQWPGATGLGIDASPVALDYAQRNANRLGMQGRARFCVGNWADGVTDRFDLVLANPPYIADTDPLPAEVRDHEPDAALFAGADGLDAYRALVPQLPRLLTPDGVAVLEIGASQAEAARGLLNVAGLSPMLHHDLANRPRALSATFRKRTVI